MIHGAGAAHQRHVNPYDDAHKERATRLYHRPTDVILTAHCHGGEPRLVSNTSPHVPSFERSSSLVGEGGSSASESLLRASRVLPTHLAFPVEEFKEHPRIDELVPLNEEEEKQEEKTKYTVFIPPRVTKNPSWRSRWIGGLLTVADCVLTFAVIGTGSHPTPAMTALFLSFVLLSNLLFVLATGSINTVFHTVALLVLMLNLLWSLVEGLNDLLMARNVIAGFQGLYILRVRSLATYFWFTP